MPAFARYLAPLLAFLALGALLYKGLGIDPRTIPSPLIDKPAPAFRLPELKHPDKFISNTDFQGKVTLLNVWATWCVACRQEHQNLVLLRQKGVDIYGLNYKDKRPAAEQWLQQFGNPYIVNAFDADGRVGIDWGVYGTPETFVIDKHGIIRHKHIGPISLDAIENEILPLVKKLREAN